MQQQLGFFSTVISSDKDLLQLVDEKTQVYSPYADEGTLYDKEKVEERFGVTPELIPDVIALIGDSADNIPKIPGIGERSAVELVKAFGPVESILQNIEKVTQEIRHALSEHEKTIRLNKELGRETTDTLLKRVAGALQESCPDEPCLIGRLNGADFTVLAPEVDSVNELARQIVARALLSINDPSAATEHIVLLGAAVYRHGDAVSQVLRSRG